MVGGRGGGLLPQSYHCSPGLGYFPHGGEGNNRKMLERTQVLRDTAGERRPDRKPAVTERAAAYALVSPKLGVQVLLQSFIHSLITFFIKDAPCARVLGFRSWKQGRKQKRIPLSWS